MAMEVDGASCSSMPSTIAEAQRETTPTRGVEKSNAHTKSPMTSLSPLRAKDDITSVPLNRNSSRRTTSAGSILGKRNASVMEQPELAPGENATLAEATFRYNGHGGKQRHQAIEQVVLSAFRRESMISPMDPVSEYSISKVGAEAQSPLPTALGRHMAQMPPLPPSPNTKDSSLVLLRKLSSIEPNLQEGDVPASLPGFKSMFGALELGALFIIYSTLRRLLKRQCFRRETHNLAQ
jgi:hypothetical protein